jgi:hypothetical protein
VRVVVALTARHGDLADPVGQRVRERRRRVLVGRELVGPDRAERLDRRPPLLDLPAERVVLDGAGDEHLVDRRRLGVGGQLVDVVLGLRRAAQAVDERDGVDRVGRREAVEVPGGGVRVLGRRREVGVGDGRR